MPAITHVHDLIAPEPPDACEIAMFPVAVVPFALAALEYRIPRYIWNDDSYERGVQLVRSLQLALLCGGVKEITDRQDNLYRMLAGALLGTTYSVVSTDPITIVEPPIYEYISPDFDNVKSVIGRMEDMRQLLQNALNGTETPLYERPDGVRDLLEQIKVVLEAEDDLDPEMLEKLAEIALALL